jgi:hypothetical protein
VGWTVGWTVGSGFFAMYSLKARRASSYVLYPPCAIGLGSGALLFQLLAMSRTHQGDDLEIPRATA